MKDKDRHYIIIKELIRGYGVHKHIYTQYRTMRTSQVVLVVKNMPVNLGDTGLILGVVKIAWKRAWQPTPIFLSAESPGQRSLVGYGP